MAFTTAQVEALEKAIAEGVKRVKYADKEVEYNSLDEMIRLLNLMKNDLGINSDARSSITGVRVKPYFDKGL